MDRRPRARGPAPRDGKARLGAVRKDAPRAGRPANRHRRALRRDERAIRRLPHRRGARLRRRALDRGRNPDAARRRHRRGARGGAPGLIDFDALYRDESRRVLATLIRLLGDFDLAEEALSEAFAAAIEQWPRDGVPQNPRAWLVSAGRFKAIDGIRRRARYDTGLEDFVEGLEAAGGDPAEAADEALPDDRLRLIFTCCHPALGSDTQVAMTLRE